MLTSRRSFEVQRISLPVLAFAIGPFAPEPKSIGKKGRRRHSSQHSRSIAWRKLIELAEGLPNCDEKDFILAMKGH